MKNKFILSLVLIAVLGIPSITLSHGMMMDFDNLDTGSEMMEYIEDKALGDNEELHEEMESLMEKMMQGAITEEETDRMVELMNQYPGVQSMMMGRMMGGMMGGLNSRQGLGNWNMMPWQYGMMGGSGFGWWLIIFLFCLVWFVVGILAIIWFWQRITKK